MPIFEFRCKKCNAHLEVYKKFSAKSPSKCQKCGGRLEKVVSAPAIQFKGEGWYVTDYASKGRKAEKAEKEKPSAEPAAEKAKPKETSTKKSSSDPA